MNILLSLVQAYVIYSALTQSQSDNVMLYAIAKQQEEDFYFLCLYSL